MLVPPLPVHLRLSLLLPPIPLLLQVAEVVLLQGHLLQLPVSLLAQLLLFPHLLLQEVRAGLFYPQQHLVRRLLVRVLRASLHPLLMPVFPPPLVPILVLRLPLLLLHRNLWAGLFLFL